MHFDFITFVVVPWIIMLIIFIMISDINNRRPPGAP
jgi:hypothetical protein